MMYATAIRRLCHGTLLFVSLTNSLAAGEGDDRYAVAVQHYLQGHWALAEQSLEEFLTLHPQHAEAQTATFYLAESMVQQGKFPDAQPLFQRLLDVSAPHRFKRHALFRSAELFYLRGERDHAQQQLLRFREQYPNDSLDAYVLPYLADIALESRDGRAARNAYQNALERFPQGPLADQCRLGLGRAQVAMDDIEAAQVTFEVLGHRGNPLADQAHLQLGILHYNQREYGQAIKEFDLFQERFSESPFRGHTLYWQSLTHGARGEWSEAGQLLKTFIQENPRHELLPAATFWLGESLRQTGEFKESFEYYERVSSEWPDSPWADDAMLAQLRLATEAVDNVDVAALAERFQKHLSSSPLSDEISACVGRWWLRQKQYDLAAAVFRQRIERNAPTAVEVGGKSETSSSSTGIVPWSLYYLALCDLGRADYQQTLQTLDSIHNVPDDQALMRGIRDARATALMGAKAYTKAIPVLEECLRDSSASGEAVRYRLQLALAHAQCGDWDQAMSLHRQAVARDRSAGVPPASTTQATALHRQAVARDRSAGVPPASTTQATALHQRAAVRDRSAGVPPASTTQATALHQRVAVRDTEDGVADHVSLRLAGRPPEGGTTNARDGVFDQASLRLAELAAKAKRGEDALELYSAVIARESGSEHSAVAMLEAASLLEQSEQRDQAADLLERLLADHPKFERADAALYQLAWIRADLGQAEKAAVAFRQLTDRFPHSEYWADAIYRQAERASREGQFEEAVKLVARLDAEESPAEIHKHALYLRGQLAASMGRWEQVAEPMQRLLDRFPQSDLRAPAQYWIAESLYRQQQYAEADEWFQQIETRDEADDAWVAMVPLRRAQILLRDEQWQAASALAVDVTQRFPAFRQKYEVEYVLGRCLAMQGRFDDARTHYEQVIRSPAGGQTETAAMAQWMIGESYLHQKKYDEALRAFERMESLYAYPRWQAAALLQAGKCHQWSGRSEQAAKLFSRVLSDYPDSVFSKEASDRRAQLSALPNRVAAHKNNLLGARADAN